MESNVFKNLLNNAMKFSYMNSYVGINSVVKNKFLETCIQRVRESFRIFNPIAVH